MGTIRKIKYQAFQRYLTLPGFEPVYIRTLRQSKLVAKDLN